MQVLHAVTELATHLADIPNPDATQPDGVEGVTTILGWLKWIGYAVVAGAMIVGGTMIAVSFRRGEGHDALPKVLWPMAGAIVIGSGATWIATIAG